MSPWNLPFDSKADAPGRSAVSNTLVERQAQTSPAFPLVATPPFIEGSATAAPAPVGAPPLEIASNAPLREYVAGFTFRRQGPEEAEKFFAALKESAHRFPYQAPHEVAHARGPAGDSVAVLIQLPDEQDETFSVRKHLKQWCEASSAGDCESCEWLTAPVPGRKKGSLSAVLGSSYRILGQFGNLQISPQTGLDPAETEYARRCLEPEHKRQEFCRCDSAGAQEHLRCSKLGEYEWKARNAKGAVFWWAQAVHYQESAKDYEETPYLYLHYVASGLDLPDIAAAFVARVDRIRSGGIRLAPSSAIDLRALARLRATPGMRVVLGALLDKYLAA